VCFVILLLESTAQYNWKQEKDQDGIKVFSSDVAGSNFKAVKVECTLTGTYVKLFNLIVNVEHNNEWVYNSKKNIMLKKMNPLDYIYYTETHFPWPLDNRDAVIHVRIRTDSMPNFFTIAGTGEPNYIPEAPGKIRIRHYSSYWKVTMPTSQTIKIYYVLEADPGGNIPGWMGNMFIDKGPYETFKKLSEMLVK
jgi:hypothetical protein